MKKEYLQPNVFEVTLYFEGCIATSKAGSTDVQSWEYEEGDTIGDWGDFHYTN